jgi:hypothetical protein
MVAGPVVTGTVGFMTATAESDPLGHKGATELFPEDLSAGRHLHAVSTGEQPAGAGSAAPPELVEHGAQAAAVREVDPSFLALLDRHLPLTEPEQPEGTGREARRARVRWLASQNLAVTTRGHYRDHLLAWASWCAHNDTPAFPADPAMLAEHFVDYVVSDASTAGDADQKKDDEESEKEELEWDQLVAVSTAQLRLAAINKLHELEQQPRPGEALIVQQVLHGLARTFGVRTKFRRAAIDIAMLERILTVVRGAEPLRLRRQLAKALHAGHQVTPGQLARLQWQCVQIDEAGARLSLPPTVRYGQRVPLLLQARRRRDAAALAALRQLAQLSGAPAERTLLCRPDGTPISRQGVMAMLATPGEPVGGAPGRAAALRRDRDCALLLLGFHGALRRVSLETTNWCHLTRTSEGWELLLPFSKNDQTGVGHRIFLSFTQHSTFSCPAAALDTWLATVTAELGHDPRDGSGRLPAFPRLTATGQLHRTPTDRLARMSGASINDLIASLAKTARLLEDLPKVSAQAGRNPFGGHSLRAGFITECIRKNIDISEIALTTGHRSFAVLLGYYREIHSRLNNPSRQLLTETPASSSTVASASTTTTTTMGAVGRGGGPRSLR